MSIEGFTAPGFEAVRDVFARAFENGQELGASFAAIRAGEVLVDLRGGFADRARTRAWTASTLAPVYSTTKPIAALVVAWLVERGMLDFETPVAAYWPEFAAHGKGDLTLAQAMSHQAGLPGFPEPIDPGLWLDPPALAAALAAMAPMWPPGTAHGYHPLTYGYLVGEVVRRAAGRTLGTILRQDIILGPGAGGSPEPTASGATPMDSPRMTEPVDFWIGLPASEHPRVADIQRPTQPPAFRDAGPEVRAAFLSKWAAPDRGGAAWREIEIPSANGHGGALAVARLYAAFAEGGLLEGRALFGPETYEALTRSRARGRDRVLPFETDFAAGVMRNSQGVYGPNPRTLGHSGWGGSMAFGDPDRRLSAAYVMNKQSPYLQGDPRAQVLIAALYESA